MISSKKLTSLFITVLATFAFFTFIGTAKAVTPTLSFSNISGDSVQVNVTGDANASVVLYYISTNAGLSIQPIGSTNSYGSASIGISSSQYNIASNGSTYVIVNNQRSSTVTWPNITSASSNTALILSQTSLVMTTGQTNTITVNPNGNAGTLYVSNNSNSQVANVSVANNQVTVSALSVGSTVVTICPLNSPSTNCASIYLTVVQNSTSAQSLSFNQNNVTVANNQTVPVTVSGGTGVYTILNNSNSSAVTATLSGTTINLYGTGTSGTASITICSTDMSSCGIITATIGTVSTTGVTFSQTYPTLGTGQTLAVSIYGGGGNGTYSISSNSNASVISPSISGSTLNLYGSNTGTAIITICSTSGSCGTITPTVSYTSTGGSLTLSQTSLTLLLGQTLSVTVSGGTAPYSLPATNNSSIVQTSLNNNIITITGLNAGSANLYVCSAGGACTNLSVTVNSAAVSSGNLQPVFGQNNFSMTTGQSMSVSLSGTSAYTISNNSNSSIASAYISGTNLIITANSLGSDSITVCQSGGLCNTLSFNVVSTNNTTSGTVNPIFSPTTVSISAGQNISVGISGGSSSGYYLASNSNPSATQVTVSGNNLNISGVSVGSSIAVVCSSASSCSPLFITVNAASSVSVITFSSTNPTVGVGQSAYVTLSGATSYYISSSQNTFFNATVNGSILSLVGLNAGSASITICSSNGSCVPLFVTVTSVPVQTTVVTSTTKYIFLHPIVYGNTNTDVTQLQKRLTAFGVYKGPITGYFGSLTLAAVKKYQKMNGLAQLGNVGPGTRAALNK